MPHIFVSRNTQSKKKSPKLYRAREALLLVDLGRGLRIAPGLGLVHLEWSKDVGVRSKSYLRPMNYYYGNAAWVTEMDPGQCILLSSPETPLHNLKTVDHCPSTMAQHGTLTESEMPAIMIGGLCGVVVCWKRQVDVPSHYI